MSIVKIEKSIELKNRRLDEEELKTLVFIKNNLPDLEEDYLLNINAGRRGIFQRLFQSFIREQLIEEERVFWYEGDNSRIGIKLPSGNMVQFEIERLHSLGRFDIVGDAFVSTNEDQKILSHPVEFLELLKEEGLLKEASEEQFHRFKLEIQNGVANLTLALTGAEIKKRELSKKIKNEEIHTTLEWVLKQKKINKNFSPLAFYEQCVVEGHPLHPGAKTKFGLDVSDVIRYSPEWCSTPEVVVVAVSKDFCVATSIDENTIKDCLFNEYGELKSIVEKLLQKNGLATEDFELIPVHPWQYENTLYPLYKKEIEQMKIIPILGFRIPTQSLVSFRSLAPIQMIGGQKHHIKTAVNVQTTSAVRTVSPNSVVNGPILSRILTEIQERENGFDGKFIVLKERAGVYFQPNNVNLSGDEGLTLQANLASILRENPENYIENEDEIPMAAASLIAESPISGKPIVVELVEDFAKSNGLTNSKEAAILFIQKYAQVSLPGFLTMMVRYGISLEGHMQNSVTVFRKGELVRILSRDFGGVRVLPERMNKQGFQAEFYPDSSIVTEEESQLRNIISYSVMQNHFAELISCLVRALDITEAELWKQVVDVCKTVFENLKKDPMIAEQAISDEVAFFQPEINLKALATMRLRGDITAYSFMKVPNPMTDLKGEIK